MYFVALDGVSRYALSEAVKTIIRGALGHTFFPTPVEFRQQCDKAIEPHLRHAERVRQREEQERERTERDRVIGQRSPDAKARVSAAYARFCAGYETEKHTVEEAERAEIRARYGITDEAVASIPDQPIPSNFKRLA